MRIYIPSTTAFGYVSLYDLERTPTSFHFYFAGKRYVTTARRSRCGAGSFHGPTALARCRTGTSPCRASRARWVFEHINELLLYIDIDIDVVSR